MTLAAFLVEAAQIYGLIGAGVAALFLSVGVDRIDEDARGAYVFRPLLIPAILLIWPLVLWRWLREESGQARWQGRHSPPRAAHTIAALAMSLVIVLALGAGFALRQSWPAGDAPQLVSPPPGDQP